MQKEGSGGRTWLRWFLILPLVLVVAMASLLAFLMYTPAGRAVLAVWIEDFTSAKIPGSMKVHRIERVGLLRPVATDIEFFTPEGQRVLYVERGEVDLSVKALLAGKVGFKSARADGGVFVIEINEGGGTNVQDAFSNPDGKAKLELHDMHLEGMRVVLRMDGTTRFVVEDAQGFLSVWRRDTKGARVSLGRVKGRFAKPEILGNTIELTRMDGQVWAKEDHVVEIELATKIGGGGIRAHLDYYDRPETPAVLRLEPEVGGGAIIASVATDVRSWFSDKLDVTLVDVEGPAAQDRRSPVSPD